MQMQGQEANAPNLTLYPIYWVLPPSTAEEVHQAPAAAPAAAPLSSGSSAKKTIEYIKKPLNAFMLYLKDQRPKVKAELNIKNSSALNKVLGERWTSLSPEEKDKYFQQAHQEQMAFKQKHPGWSSAQNYGKRKKKRAVAASDEESEPEDLSPTRVPCCTPEGSDSAPPPPPSATHDFGLNFIF